MARDPLVRSGLVAVLSAYPGLVLKEALATADANVQADVDVVVWDEREPSAPGPAPILALVSAAAEARQALQSGARGALSRSAPPHSIAPAALAVAAGHWVVDESFGRALLAAPPPPPAPRVETWLTPREQEVLELMSEGLSNRDIADRLGISRHTAKFHVNAVLDKLGAASRTEAVVLGARSGLLSL